MIYSPEAILFRFLAYVYSIMFVSLEPSEHSPGTRIG